MASNLVVCGGTFDHLHKGHKEFLNYASSLGKEVIVGLTSNKYVKNRKFQDQNSSSIESYRIRRKNLEEFLSQKEVQGKVSIIKIDDLFGPTLSKELLIDKIVVSEGSKKGADAINRKRKELGLNPLKIFIIPPIKAEDGELISSARIRKGEINSVGRLYVEPSWFKINLVLSEDLRQEFKEPMGLLCQKVDQKIKQIPSYTISVGDETSLKFNEISVNQGLSIVDFKVARKERFSSFLELGFKGNEIIITASNPRGHITSDLFNAISEIFKAGFKNRTILKVVGEEDLAVLPLILLSPLGVNIYYGQPNEGLIKVVVSVDTKNKAYNLVSKLRPM